MLNERLNTAVDRPPPRLAGVARPVLLAAWNEWAAGEEVAFIGHTIATRAMSDYWVNRNIEIR